MRRAWVILLLIALLPLHGWAASAMAVKMAATGSTEAAAPAAVASVAQATGVERPCHEAASVGHVADDRGGDRAPHDCASCHLCHAWVAVLPGDSVTPPPAMPAELPGAHPRDTGRLMPAGLERPPRA